MPSRDIMDNRIGAQENATEAEQQSKRGQWGSAHPLFGQTLNNNGKPADQTEVGPELLPNMAPYSRIDVYEGPDGLAWVLVAEAEEAGLYYLKESTKFDGQPIVQSEWVEMPSNYVPF